MSRSPEERWALFLYVATDVVVYGLALSIAPLARLHTLGEVEFVMLLRDRLVCMALFMTVAVGTGCYARYRLTDRFDSVYCLLIALLGASLAQFMLLGLLPTNFPRAISRRELVIAGALSGMLLGGWRYAIAALLARLEAFHRLFWVTGDDTEGKRIAEAITGNPGALSEARYISFESLQQECLRREGDSGTERASGQDVIIVLKGANKRLLPEMVTFSEEHCRRTFLYPSLNETFFFHHARLLAIAGLPLIEVANPQTATPYHYVKRAMDISVAAMLLFCAIPIGLVTAVAIKLTSRGPVFYGQERMGWRGRVFKLYKFRSMIVDAEAHTGPVWASGNDPRVTPVGRFIRRHRIDEIPQLFSVLKGDMSLVGPRPERPHFHREFCKQWPLFERRLAVRPGLTSLSHVLGSYSSNPEDRLRYDLAYIGSMSLLTDLRILVSTVRVVLGAKGAQ